MPARVSHSSLPGSTPKQAKKRNKSNKRTLNAFAIAEAQEPERHRIRRTRLGNVEEDEASSKRGRTNGDEDEDEDEAPRKRLRGEDDGEATDSDGQGNRWRMGVVDEDDDSEIDSDEAFGSSDEERFDGWTFRGGASGPTSKSKAKRQIARQQDEVMTLNEDEAEESDDDSLGSEAVDLATMLDNYQESDDDDDDDGTDGDDENEFQGLGSGDSMSEGDEEDLDQSAKLKSLVSRLQPEEKAVKETREADFHESKAPSAAGVVSAEKFDIMDFLATSDPQMKKVSKEIGTLPKVQKKDLKLAPSLPKRQKDKLDRVVANEKAKETLNRWVDTVQQQRRAEHLSFPLVDPDAVTPSGSKHLLPTSSSKPFNELESAIASIMQESGLGSGRRDEEEQKLLEFEELKTNKMPMEEVLARRAELRKARDLLFREEVRAKRIKKIKSKAFRRIKRKEREKLAAMDRDAFKEGWDDEVDDEEREDADRKRAEERMSLKHKDSKWSKQMKKSGRATWDDEAISGMTEMARKQEELKRRIEGKEVHDSDASGDEIFSSDDDDNASDVADDDNAELRMLQRQMNRAQDYGELDEGASKLHALKFMKDAEARRKEENEQLMSEVRRELAGEGSGSEDGGHEETIGRKIFAPSKQTPLQTETNIVRGQFEERDASEDEESERNIVVGLEPVRAGAVSKTHQAQPRNATGPSQVKPDSQRTKSVKPAKSKGASATIDEPSATLLVGEKHSQPDADGWVTVSYDHDSEPEEENVEAGEVDAATGLLSQTEILRRAFAGDDVEDAFEAEKAADVSDEDEKMIDETLPGWGSWVGTGLSKREKAKNSNRKLVKKDGIKRDDRQDKHLKGVIISQKRIKKNTAYLANELPHEFGTKREYEGAMRMPIGGEWNTRSTLQSNVKPRVIVKPNAIVKPMSKPLV